jgi:ABC-type glycerol-3-phosphate transport system permease component
MATLTRAADGGELGHREAQRHARKAAWSERIGRIVTLIVLFGGAVMFIVPYYVTVAMSLKTQQEFATTSMWAWPQQPTFDNFIRVLTNPNVVFSLLLQNTLLIALLGTLGVILSCSAAAYAFARLDFAGKDRLFLVLLGTMMLPGLVTMIPGYVLMAKIGWVNTFLPLIVPAFFGSPFFIFLLRQFYMSIPRELDEAAVLDGAGHATIFSRVILPLSGPALAAVGIFSFMGGWRDLMGPILYLNDPEKQTLEIGLRTYAALNGEKWHLLMAGSVLVSIPLIILFLVGQRAFIKGIVMTGGK